MAEREIYTRVYSSTSAGQLVSGKDARGSSLSRTQLRDEFRNHSVLRSQTPTALVSVSNRIIDTVKRAYEKRYISNESPADIWIVFIEVPAPDTAQNQTVTRPGIHSALELAEEFGFPRPNLRYHEFVFEWAIPDEYVLHKVSLQTLMGRGLSWEQYLLEKHPYLGFRIVPTLDLRSRIFEVLYDDDPWEIRASLGEFAQRFGARAPTNWIAHRLFYDCVRCDIQEYQRECQIATLRCAHGRERLVGFEFLRSIDDAITEPLPLPCILWAQEYEEFESFQKEMEDCMAETDIDFWERWHHAGDVDDEDPTWTEKERALYLREWNQRLARHKESMAEIEKEALRIGL